ncbi:TetR/AcrR family transcriptional regulator [Halapricum desulfuricans]|uniref:Transcriptional regulator, TetR/AcrR family n=1 Tax=Halapricum desulfuricans TaxID=2841257 RepID=A0A897NGW7_9EURY|nr:TetR/AcrR family transcriptional regulator [Halapricum desulfuricans]QSG10213.1 Transcriptional regulator, TetR/AcrR family [Halapricum desulfuricans]
MSGFSSAERERIRRDLIEAGSDLFSRLGLERTRVTDLTDEVGIGTSTFYTFFDSKGELYLTVLDDEIERLARSYTDVLRDEPDIESEVRVGLEILFEELETNPLFYRSVVENERQQLLRSLAPERQQQFKEGEDTLLVLAERWTDHPRFRVDEPQEVVNVLRMLAQTVRTREAFETLRSVAAYEAARDALIETLVRGFVEPA